MLDADSIEMRLEDGRGLHIQLLGIDAPDAGKAQRGGHANEFARAKPPKGRRVFLEQGPKLWDDHGRYLALVWLKRPETGTNHETSVRMLNATLLVSGFAAVEVDDENPKYGTFSVNFSRRLAALTAGSGARLGRAHGRSAHG